MYTYKQIILILSLVSSSVHFSSIPQLCPTLWDSMDCSLPGSSVHGILQARTLEWVAIPVSRGSSQPRDQTWVSYIEGRFFTVWATRRAQFSPLSFSQHWWTLKVTYKCEMPVLLFRFHFVNLSETANDEQIPHLCVSPPPTHLFSSVLLLGLFPRLFWKVSSLLSVFTFFKHS